MNDRTRRILIFTGIVGTGSLLIVVNLPLLLILPLILCIGIVLLILLGALPVSELKGMLLARLKKGKPAPAAPASPGKAGTKTDTASRPSGTKRLPFGLDAVFRRKEKTAPQKTTGDKTRAQSGFRSLFKRKPAKTAPVPAQNQKTAAETGKKKGVFLHFSSFADSIRAMKTILTTRKKTDPDKLKKIDTMLDYAVSEKAGEPAPPSSPLDGGAVPEPAAAAAGGTGELPVPTAEEDPFLSLSNDEIEAGLLDDLDDEPVMPAPEPAGDDAALSVPLPDEMAGLTLGESDMPIPPQDVTSSAEPDLPGGEEDLPDLSALEGIESVDENLGELDSLNLDSVELDDDSDEDDGPVTEPVAPEPAPAETAAPAPPASPAAAGSPGPGSGKSDQSEMAAFAAASGGDDDMLSSLAADIKTVKKEQDISLLRELKDFRAPGTTIETELSDLYSALNAAAEKQKKARANRENQPVSK